MSEPTREEIRTIWRQLAQRNDWALVEDEAAFLDQAAAESLTLLKADTPHRRAQLGVRRTYSALLYRGLRNREDRAAQELWSAFVRTALRDSWPQSEAEELAQETIACLIERLPRVTSPQGLLSYAFLLFRTLRRDWTRQRQRVQPLHPDRDEPAQEPADSIDMAARVEQYIVGEQLRQVLRDKLPNDLERETLLRIVIFGDHPRDVARALGLPLHRTRLAKSRALKRLREDEELLRILRDLTGNQDLPPPAQGEPNDDS